MKNSFLRRFWGGFILSDDAHSFDVEYVYKDRISTTFCSPWGSLTGWRCHFKHIFERHLDWFLQFMSRAREQLQHYQVAVVRVNQYRYGTLTRTRLYLVDQDRWY